MKKQEKLKKCKEILHKYSINSKITNFDDLEFLLSVFEGHDEWDLKKGCGIDYIQVEYTQYRNKCFYIYRTDGTKTDISFNHSINNRSDLANIKIACRNAIRKEIVLFREKNVSYGKTKCPFTNEILTIDNTHIDHYNLSFNDLFKEWLRNKDVGDLVKKLNQTNDNEVETYFIDEKIVLDFLVFHNKNTHLRAVSKKANLSFLNNL